MTRKPPGKTSQFKIAAPTKRIAVDAHELSRERLASDIEAFRAGGGTIEVLGITPVPTASELDRRRKAAR
jgi:hypothetical protein